MLTHYEANMRNKKPLGKTDGFYSQVNILLFTYFFLHLKQNLVTLFSQVAQLERPENVEYAVGMVMDHKHYKYTCVIYNWHPVCMASLEWQRTMNIDRLEYKANQPYYNVFADDGSQRYVAQGVCFEFFTFNLKNFVLLFFRELNTFKNKRKLDKK